MTGNVETVQVSDNMPIQSSSNSDKLGHHVSQSLQAKLINGEYVDLAQLAYAPSSVSGSGDQAKYVSLVTCNGELVVKGKVLQGISQQFISGRMCCCFFISIYADVHSHETTALLKNICKIFGWEQVECQALGGRFMMNNFG